MAHIFPDQDDWNEMPDGTRTCSFCGSLHPEDAVDILYKYLEDPTYHFEPTSKGYKFYLNSPGVRNASEGGIKFYTWHGDGEADVEAAYYLAVKVYNVRYQARWGSHDGEKADAGNS